MLCFRGLFVVSVIACEPTSNTITRIGRKGTHYRHRMWHRHPEQGQGVKIGYKRFYDPVLIIQKMGKAAIIGVPVTVEIKDIGHVSLFKWTTVNMLLQKVTGKVAAGMAIDPVKHPVPADLLDKAKQFIRTHKVQEFLQV